MSRRNEMKEKRISKFKVMAEKRKNITGGGSRLYDLPDDVEMFKAAKGTNQIDIVPYKVTVSNHPEVKKDEVWCERTFYVHRGVGPEEEWFVCPQKTVGKPCPICEERLKLKKDEDADDETLKALKPSMRQLFNVLTENGVVPWSFPHWNFGMLLEEEVRQSDDDSLGYFYELKGGKTLIVRFKERTSSKGSYLEASRIDFEDRDDLDENILGDAYDLDRILIIPSYEELQKAFLGVSSESNENEDEDKDDEDKAEIDEEEETPKRHLHLKQDDDEDDDEDDLDMSINKKQEKSDEEDDDEEDDEEDEPVRRKSHRTWR